MRSADPYLGIYSLARLEALGLSRRSVSRALDEGRLIRIRRGWFHEPDAAHEAVAAVRVGGVLTATSAAVHHGLWTAGDNQIHVLVSRNTSRLRLESSQIESRAVCLHWARGRVGGEVPLADPLQIVVDANHCQPRTTTVALADSALNQQLLSLDALEVALPRVAPWCDPSSQSGTESIVRVRLRSRGVALRSQVPISGVGYVDLVVGERLVIECDSAAFHDGYHSQRDYERDQELLRQGYLVLRLKYRHVMYDWARIEGLILGVVRARRHRWRAGSNASGSFLAL
ncbi:MAG: DUF559 domain-containing protein [Marmoricola sp.]